MTADNHEDPILTSNRRRELEVIIVGAGIGGAALAVALEKHDIAFEIYERANGFNYVGSSFTIQPNGVQAMNDIDAEVILAARKLGVSQNEGTFIMKTSRGEVLGTPYQRGKVLVSESMGLEPGIILKRQSFHSILLDRFDNAKLHLNHKVIGLEFKSDGKVSVKFENGAMKTADVVVSADGVNSTLRTSISSEKPEESYYWVAGQTKVGEFPSHCLPRNDRRLYFGKGDFPFFFGACPGGDDVEWGVVVPEKRVYSLEEIQDGYADYESAKEILKNARSLEGTKDFHPFTSSKLASLSTWHAGGLVLMGDSAHPISQVSGQGANMAIEDARRLALELNAYKTGESSSIENSLRSYEACRMDRVNAIVYDNARRTRSMFVSSTIGEAMRNMFLKFLLQVVQPNPRDWIDPKFNEAPASADKVGKKSCGKCF